ncbi:membrane protein insertase YidC [Candidatus Giovannonibacteria bacterium]|nr:membrane protein insertase YidC [Candidatus Giovannonibacteria bacterium]
MAILKFIYFEILYRPLLNALVFLAALMPGNDIGFSIIILTLIVRAILFPFSHRSLLTQIKLKDIEPEIKKIKDETKNKAEEQGKKIMELYKRHGVSPFSGCLMLLIQLPILIALFHVFQSNLLSEGGKLYSFINMPSGINVKFLNLFDLSKSNWILALTAGVSQYFQMRLAMPVLPKGGETMREEFSRAMAIQSLYIFPILIFYISFRFPAALALYWTVTNLFATVHESVVRSRAKKEYGGESGEDKKNN